MTKAITKYHYTSPYIINPEHPVTVQVIGAGGNGSQVVTQLARINKALKGLGHPGIHVTLFDDDKITQANMGRQLFSPAELNMNKATALITRINRFFGYHWKALPIKFDEKIRLIERSANITISCVDSVQARKAIYKCLKQIPKSQSDYYTRAFYWMDLGNTQNTGQFIIGTLRMIEQNKKDQTGLCSNMPTIFDKFPNWSKQKTKDTGPSCSLAQALEKQDLFINSMLTQHAMHLLWKMFREGKIHYHGAFINLETLKIAPIYL